MGLLARRTWQTAVLSLGVLLSCDGPEQAAPSGTTTGATSVATVDTEANRESTGTTAGSDSATGSGGETASDAAASDDGELVCPDEDKVYEGDVALVTAEDVAALEGYTIIAGDLVILASELKDLEGLECIIEIEGNLIVVDNDQLTSLMGLGGLGFIGGDLIVTGNRGVEDLAGLNPEVHVVGQRIFSDDSSDGSSYDSSSSSSSPPVPEDLDVTIGPVVTHMTPVAPGTAINVNTTWDLAGSPYIIGPGAGDLTISAGVTLTIEAGVEVHMGAGDTGRFISVDGTLNVQGTAANPVIFRHETLTSANSWEGIILQSGSSSSLSYAEVHHADNALRFTSPGVGNHTVDNVTVATFSASGIVQTSGTLVVTNLTATGTGTSTYCANSSGTFTADGRVIYTDDSGIMFVVSDTGGWDVYFPERITNPE